MNVRLYFTRLPKRVHGMVFPKYDPNDGEVFIICLNPNLCFEKLRESLLHELWHIWNDDFSSGMSADQVEVTAHSFGEYEGPNFYPTDFLMSIQEILEQPIRYVEEVA